MLCVFFLFIYLFFFLCLYTRTCRNNASIFNFSSFSGSKMNLIGVLGRLFFEIPNGFQKHQEKQNKKKINKGKNGNFYAKLVFDQIDFFIWLLFKN
ncbi:Uncharacterized protein FWK35_00009416 [Aphis craccivora]|uniref:Secreted protein n=1 Tax=Aphis craccivora TaxID=307492 RepID=A0A6G0ZPB2_APHCR|nr:Uncharacterized protein FWK35_00009416 [Aphis craccivora]